MRRLCSLLYLSCFLCGLSVFVLPMQAAQTSDNSISPLHTDGVINCNGTQSAFISAERRLMKCLLSDIDPAVRPIMDPQDAVNVTVDMILMQVVDLDEKSQILDVNGWIQKSWYDPQLRWDPKQYENVQTMRIPTERIWLPDIVLLNTAETSHSYVMDKLAVVRYDGFVNWIPHARLRSFCYFDMSRFPFDTQHCHILLGSWSYDERQVNVTIPSNATQKYLWDKKEWDIMNFHAKRRVHPYSINLGKKSAVVDSYPYIAYTLELRRTSPFYGTILIAPPVLLALLMLSIFHIPPEASERITLGIGIVISLSVFISVVDDYMPAEVEGMPIIFMYILFEFVMSTFAVLISIIVLNCHHRGVSRHKVPNWLRTLALGRLRKIFCIKSSGYNSVPTDVAYTDASAELRYDPGVPRDQELEAPLPKSPTLALEKVLDEIRRYLKALSGRPSGASSFMDAPLMVSHRQMIEEEWQMVAMVIDRLAFWIYVIISVLVTAAILSH